MATDPGWHPDPDGTPDRYRHWDGTRWSARTATAAELRPRRLPRPPRWVLAALAALAVAALVAVAVLALPRRGPGDEPSAAATPAYDGDPCTKVKRVSTIDHGYDYSQVWANRLHLPRPDGWDDLVRYEDDMYTYQEQLLRTSTTAPGFSSGILLGGVARGDAYPDPRTAAGRLLACYLKAGYNITTPGETVLDERHDVDTSPGWRLRQQLVAGGNPVWVEVVVVDTGDPRALEVAVLDAISGDAAERDLTDAASRLAVKR